MFIPFNSATRIMLLLFIHVLAEGGPIPNKHPFETVLFKEVNDSFVLVVHATHSSTTPFIYDRGHAALSIHETNGNCILIDNSELEILNPWDPVLKSRSADPLIRFSLVLDNSASVDEDSMRHLHGALADFFENLPASFQAQIIKFSDEIQDKTEFLSQKGPLLAKIREARPQSGSALFDAIDLAVMELQYSGDDVPFQFCLIVSDGHDNASIKNRDRDLFRKKLAAKWKTKQIPTFFVGVTDQAEQDLLAAEDGFHSYRAKDFAHLGGALELVSRFLRDSFIFRFPARTSSGRINFLQIVHKTDDQTELIQKISIP